MLLTRAEFRSEVFHRDGHKCVICDGPGKDAHHILERRLWDDGGYYRNNGATLCEQHHIEAEKTTLSTEEIRDAAGITKVILPAHLYPDHCYDKWGNVILSNGSRMVGELFFDESVQKILKDVLDKFVARIKYPRTYHLPWSPGRTKDDRTLNSVSMFEGQEVVVTTKMDGENTTLYNSYMHARSLDSQHHPSRNWLKKYHADKSWQIPGGWRVCGENLFAAHSIEYTDLPCYFLAFSIWDRDRCLSWTDTMEWVDLLGFVPVPVLYQGVWDEELIRNLDIEGQEGYVVRLADEFRHADFRTSVAKYVRADHVTTSHHWRFEKIRQNGLEDAK